VHTKPRLVRLVRVNLLANAVKATQRGQVTGGLAASAGWVRLSVRDTGAGIPADERTLVFEPFEQRESIRRKSTPGIGLGLALVREMVGALGGRVELESEVGVGSTFTVLLPAPQENA
jgi:signal transduction histidine kinase